MAKITRFEKLKQMDVKDVARVICFAISEKIEDCEQCPATDRCSRGHNGMLDYLTEEIDELENKS